MTNDLESPDIDPTEVRKPTGARSRSIDRRMRSLALQLVAWAVIVVFVAILGILPMLLLGASQSGESQSLSINDEMTGRLLIGGKVMGLDGGMMGMQAAPMREGFIEQRIAYAILMAELVGPDTGIEELERVNEAIERNEPPHSEATEELAESVGVLLFALAAGEEADALPPQRKAQLEETLGIYGELLHARASGDTATSTRIESESRRGMIALFFFGGWLLLSLLVGSILLVVLVILTVIKRMPVRFTRGPPSGSIYIETFAIWLVFHIGLQLLAGLGMPESLGTSGLLLGSMVAMFMSLLALFWPIIRGVPFARFRQETGLFARNILVEGFAGLATYTLMLPIVIVGVALSLLLGLLISFFFGELPPPEHPIQGAIGGSLLGLVMIYLVACVAAPIVEEIMFRGVLYRYLRDGTGRLGWVLSFLTSALVSSFIFAAIHPQGVTFIPILGSLAVAFCIGREWRGSLVAPMVAHALNNGVVMTLNVMLLA